VSQSEKELPWHNLAHYWQKLNKDKSAKLQTVAHGNLWCGGLKTGRQLRMHK